MYIGKKCQNTLSFLSPEQLPLDLKCQDGKDDDADEDSNSNSNRDEDKVHNNDMDELCMVS